MRQAVYFTLCGLLILAFLSCAPNIIGIKDLAKLQMGMNPKDSPRVMGREPRSIFKWLLRETGDSILVQSYLLMSYGDYASTYFLAYRNELLIFWGYPHEFARSSDPRIREIGREALSRQIKPYY
jgi:hypothetical protein